MLFHLHHPEVSPLGTLSRSAPFLGLLTQTSTFTLVAQKLQCGCGLYLVGFAWFCTSGAFLVLLCYLIGESVSCRPGSLMINMLSRFGDY